MSVVQVATRYATALLEEADRANALEETFSDVKLLEETIAGSRDLYLMLKSPIVNEGRKRAALESIFNGKVGELTANFLNLLVRKKREGYLTSIIKSFYRAYNDKKNIKEVMVISASPLSEETEKGIFNMIQSQLDASSPGH